MLFLFFSFSASFTDVGLIGVSIFGEGIVEGSLYFEGVFGSFAGVLVFDFFVEERLDEVFLFAALVVFLPEIKEGAVPFLACVFLTVG